MYTKIIYRKEGNKQTLNQDNTYTDYEKAKEDLLKELGKEGLIEEYEDPGKSYFIKLRDNVIGKVEIKRDRL